MTRADLQCCRRFDEGEGGGLWVLRQMVSARAGAGGVARDLWRALSDAARSATRFRDFLEYPAFKPSADRCLPLFLQPISSLKFDL